jgi:cell wall-associated NlpC family hydrolase
MLTVQSRTVLTSAVDEPAPVPVTAPAPATNRVTPSPVSSPAGDLESLGTSRSPAATYPSASSTLTPQVRPLRAATSKTAASPDIKAWGPLYRDSRAHGVRIAVNGCPTRALPRTVPTPLPRRQSIQTICTAALNRAPDATARAAIRFAFLHLGSTYACGGIGREKPWTFDCSSFVSRAYQAAGARTTVRGWSPNTAYMLSSAQHTFTPIAPQRAHPGDLVLYDTCPAGQTCTYRHVVMYLGWIGGTPWMLHTNSCGSPAKLAPFWGWTGAGHGALLGVRRVHRTAGGAHR